MYFGDWHDHAIPWFLEANVLPITFLYYESVSALMHDINNNKAPVKISSLFPKTSNIHSYNTRTSTSGSFMLKSSKLEIQNNSFSRLGVKLWNKMPSYITNLPKKAFKRILRKYNCWYIRNGGWLFWNPPDYQKTRVLDTLVKVLISAFLVFFSCHYALFFCNRCIN